MIYDCPICAGTFEGTEVQQPAGVGGGTYCPRCQGRIRMSFPYGWLVALISLFLAGGVMALVRVQSMSWFVVGTAVLWIPISLFLNVWSTRFRPATFKAWKERRRTLFEWLYERDSTPRLFDKKP